MLVAPLYLGPGRIITAHSVANKASWLVDRLKRISDFLTLCNVGAKRNKRAECVRNTVLEYLPSLVPHSVVKYKSCGRNR